MLFEPSAAPLLQERDFPPWAAIVVDRMTDRSTTCPGCGLELPANGWKMEQRMNTSTECWEMYGEAVGFELSNASLQQHHQLTVDTYVAQHPGGHASDLGIAFALIGLHLSLDRGVGGEEIRGFHQRLANRGVGWPNLSPPADRGRVTVHDVASAGSVDEHARQVARWSASVWEAWGPSHETVAGWVEGYYGASV
jgi:hypothetical protein